MSRAVSVTLNWNRAEIARIEDRATKGLLRMGYDIANAARRFAPYKTGALSNSIRVEENAEVVEIIAGGKYGPRDIRYAAIQEFGGFTGRSRSVHINGRHYMQNAKDLIMTGDYLSKYFGGITK